MSNILNSHWCLADVERIRNNQQSRPDSGLGLSHLHANVLNIFKWFLSRLTAGVGEQSCGVPGASKVRSRKEWGGCVLASGGKVGSIIFGSRKEWKRMVEKGKRTCVRRRQESGRGTGGSTHLRHVPRQIGWPNRHTENTVLWTARVRNNVSLCGANQGLSHRGGAVWSDFSNPS